ncbi:PTS sugar transporter subunit IIB [Clostridioides sp. ES-S-0108-01]|uniref:PTS sugar transporter subunit IIB n=1 Tax=unclassified Clostridioides TaxID=2635829 RepID=UPI001D0C1E96|nr:PTS sugar transporter subunit IIB [Clostridioides sp. ES-S-0171-01]MCC0688738.1 PTS sugar transporter subunit IIB [Clostridioides sp. ES-S-0056-01]MCC0716388.1 PTS sugar transporter subunit IIB [Clostridioides sp. ES-S-0077-01]MCC0782744.1 PTS sugar transporter subunit IIB [Clostridioides sp. ES-S-0108-01]UDN50618.1 PTS sugar transporter subunit IIB [Clostridioides sp. ES-S-0107-01]UDN54113.1 PTS sugar transporter subunit IIB [Clostridioides sp. ES-S-0054-01]
MRVLFVCSAGMSSSIAVNALQKEGAKNGIEIDVSAIGTQEFEDEIKNGWDVAMVAPQVRHRFDYLKGFADEIGVPCALIQAQAYSPLGGAKLLKQVQELLANNI